MKKITLTFVFFLIAIPMLANSAIRDAEMDGYFRELAAPLYEVAGVADGKVEVNGRTNWNAFVMAGRIVHMNAGLIMAAPGPNVLRGVLAHEIGHIAAGHVARRLEFQRDTRFLSIAGALLGAAGGLAGSGDVVGSGVMTGMGLQASANLAFSRAHEAAADQAGRKFLTEIGEDPKGLSMFLDMLDRQSGRNRSDILQYISTHPMTPDRISMLESTPDPSGLVDSDNTKLMHTHRRVQAKLKGFLMDPNAVLRSYANETDIPALMGKAIAYNRLGRSQDRDAMLKQLDQKDPNNPYNLDLAAELYYTSGELQRSCATYAQAHKARPQNPIIALGQAKCLAKASGEEKQAAVTLLLRFEPNLSDLVSYWTLLARTYDELGNQGRAEAVTAELRLRQGKKDDALWFAKRANQSLQPGDPWHARMQDIISSLDRG